MRAACAITFLVLVSCERAEAPRNAAEPARYQLGTPCFEAEGTRRSVDANLAAEPAGRRAPKSARSAVEVLVETSAELPLQLRVVAVDHDPWAAVQHGDERLLAPELDRAWWFGAIAEEIAEGWTVEVVGQRAFCRTTLTAEELARPLWVCVFADVEQPAFEPQSSFLPWPIADDETRRAGFVLHPRGAVSGRWVDGTGVAVESVSTCIGNFEAWDQDDGSFELWFLPAGRHGLRASLEMEDSLLARWTTSVDVRDDAITRLGDLAVPAPGPPLAHVLRAVDDHGQGLSVGFELRFEHGPPLWFSSDHDGVARLAGAMDGLVAIEASEWNSPREPLTLAGRELEPFEIGFVFTSGRTDRVDAFVVALDGEGESDGDAALQVFVRSASGARWRFWGRPGYGCVWPSAPIDAGTTEVLMWSPWKSECHRSRVEIQPNPDGPTVLRLRPTSPCGAVRGTLRRTLRGLDARQDLRAWIQPLGALPAEAEDVRHAVLGVPDGVERSSLDLRDERFEIRGVPAEVDLELCLYDEVGVLVKRAFRVRPDEARDLGEIVVQLRE